MTAAEFKRKWAHFQGKESAAYQSHFDDLCRLLGVPTPLEADPKGEFFCFQIRVVKDAELFDLEAPDASDPAERGFADVWKRACFGWEYKGRKKNLDEAYKQLLRYREALENPPLLVVCDFDRFIIKTNFNGAVQGTHEFTNDQIDRPENLRLLRAVLSEPEFLKPQRTTAQVTEALAETIAQVAKSLLKREAVDSNSPKTNCASWPGPARRTGNSSSPASWARCSSAPSSRSNAPNSAPTTPARPTSRRSWNPSSWPRSAANRPRSKANSVHYV